MIFCDQIVLFLAHNSWGNRNNVEEKAKNLVGDFEMGEIGNAWISPWVR